MKSKILKELPKLIEHHVISSEVAESIQNYYNKKTEANPSRLFTVFGILGATLVGLGIILILAHNWDSFSKITKTALAFTPLVIGQFIVGYSIVKRKGIVWKESSGTFLLFAVGSCISLISQIYNIPGNLSSFLLTWIGLCLPLIYLLKSKAVALFSIVLSTYYAVEMGYSLGGISHSPWLYFLLLLVIMPFYFKLLKSNSSTNVTVIFNWLIPISLMISFGAFIKDNWVFGFLMYMMLFGVFYNIGKQPVLYEKQLRRNGFLIFGVLGSLTVLITLSSNLLWKGFSNEVVKFSSQEVYLSIGLLVLSVCFTIQSFKYNKEYSLSVFQCLPTLFMIIFFIGLQQGVIATVSINIIVFVIGLLAIKRGADQFDFRRLNYGLIVIAVLISCRFFDTDMSFVLRGLLFVAVGVSFFLTNYYMLKKKKTITTNI